MKEGIVNEKGQRQLGNYILTTEPEAIFEKFFGSRNVYEHLLTVGEGEGRSHPIFSTQYDAGRMIIEPNRLPNLAVKV